MTEAVEEVIGDTVKDMVSYFYTDDGIITLPRPERLRSSLEVLAYLFNWVGIFTNVQNTVSIMCRPCHAPGGLSEAAYELRLTGIGQSYQERLKRWVQCPEFGVELAEGSFRVHRQIQNKVGRGGQGRPPHPPPPVRTIPIGCISQQCWCESNSRWRGVWE